LLCFQSSNGDNPLFLSDPRKLNGRSIFSALAESCIVPSVI